MDIHLLTAIGLLVILAIIVQTGEERPRVMEIGMILTETPPTNHVVLVEEVVQDNQLQRLGQRLDQLQALFHAVM